VLIGSPRDLRENVENGKERDDTGDDGGPPVDSDARQRVSPSLVVLSHRQMVTRPPAGDKKLTRGE